MKGIGIIGCGKISQVRHIPEFHSNPNAKLVGYYDLNAARAEQMASQYGGRVYGSMDEMLADPAIDAVAVCTANSCHAGDTIAALRAGKHVLCEKPMAVTIEDCEKMVATARECGRYLMIDQNQRYAMAHERARRLIKEGAVGRVITFRTTFGHSGPETWSITPGPGTWFFDRKSAVMGVVADLASTRPTSSNISWTPPSPPLRPASPLWTSATPTAAPSGWTTTPSAFSRWPAARWAR